VQHHRLHAQRKGRQHGRRSGQPHKPRIPLHQGRFHLPDGGEQEPSGEPLYRAPYATEWKEVTWEWALDRIAENVKKSRDKSFKFKNDKGLVVNRTEGIASAGSAAMDNEECFLYQKFLRGLGLVYIEHQARL